MASPEIEPPGAEPVPPEKDAPPLGAMAEQPSGRRADWTEPGSRSRRLLIAAAIYLVTTVVFACIAGSQRLTEHTPFNHYALLADAWLHGRQDLANGPPAYTMNNDFASFHGKTYVSFPPLPAILMLPFVKLAGSAENFRDGQFAVELAGFAPAVLFLVLEKLRRTHRSPRSERENWLLALLFAFGTVYFFTAVEGTVWFVCMVVAAIVEAIYFLAALDAEHPVLAGAMLACAYLSRPQILLMMPIFALEALRVSARGGLPGADRPEAWLHELYDRLDLRALGRRYVACAVPILLAFALATWMNWTRYGRATPFWFDHEFLTVGWHTRIMKWGLFGYHYLAKNLGIALSSLPWLPPRGGSLPHDAPFLVNEHGLAIWFTMPVYFWVFWPKRAPAGTPEAANATWLYAVVAAATALPAIFDLFYQNSGWRQFGYRFSNDYAIGLIVLIAIGARPFRALFAAAAAWSVAWNTFGAATFDKVEADHFYFREPSQSVVYQPD